MSPINTDFNKKQDLRTNIVELKSNTSRFQLEYEAKNSGQNSKPKYEKTRAKAMKTVAKLEGVASIAMQGDNMDEIMVIGEVDAVEMTHRLRKKLGSVEVIGVGEISGENREGSEDNSSIIEQVQHSFSPYYYSYYPQYVQYYQ